MSVPLCAPAASLDRHLSDLPHGSVCGVNMTSERRYQLVSLVGVGKKVVGVGKKVGVGPQRN